MRNAAFFVAVVAIQLLGTTSGVAPAEEQKHSVPPPDKTLLIEYLYEVTTATIISAVDDEETNGTITNEIKARYNFNILNYDREGGMLIRYKINECIHGACQNEHEFYAYIVQGGQNLKAVYVKLNDSIEKADWSLPLSMIYTVTSPAKSSAHGHQMVTSPFGLCNFEFTRPEDKIFVRRMYDCDFYAERNHTTIPGFYVQDYEQVVTYKQNKKFDADILTIKGTEVLTVQSALISDLSLKIHSTVHSELLNRTKQYSDRICPEEMLGGECAVKVLGAKFLGKTWLDVNRKIAQQQTAKSHSLEKFVSNQKSLLVSCIQQAECPGLFSNLVHVIRDSLPQEIEHVLELYAQDDVLPIIIHAIASGGPSKIWAKALNIAGLSGNTVLAQQFVDSLIFTETPPPSALKSLRNLTVTADKNINTLKTVGYLTNKKCQQSPSALNACKTLKDPYLQLLLNNNGSYVKNELADALWFLHFEPSTKFFSQLLCTVDQPSLELKALTYFEKLEAESFSRDINMKLLRIFWNTCPRPQSLKNSAIAVRILIRIAPKHPTIGSYILRSEKKKSSYPRQWALFYQGVAHALQTGTHETRNYWLTLRNLKAFRPNYNERSISQSPSLIHASLQEGNLALNYDGVVFGASEEPAIVLRANLGKYPLFELNIDQEAKSFGAAGIVSSENTPQCLVFQSFAQRYRFISGLTGELEYSTTVCYNVSNTNHATTITGTTAFSMKINVYAKEYLVGKVEKTSQVFNKFELALGSCVSVSDINEALLTTHEGRTSEDGNDNNWTESKSLPGRTLNLGKTVNNRCLGY